MRDAGEAEFHRTVQAAIGSAMKAHYQTLLADPLPERIVEAMNQLAHVDAKAMRRSS